MDRVKVSSRHQIAIPSSVRRQLGIEAGDYLRVEVCDGQVVLTPEPRDAARMMRGLHKEIWEGVDVEAYIKELRGSWER
jgi:AbrB family looped-hinge helix DNA binding protein